MQELSRDIMLWCQRKDLMINEFVLYKVSYETIREEDGGPFPEKCTVFLYLILDIIKHMLT